MNFKTKTLLLTALIACAIGSQNLQARHHRHGPQIGFSLNIGTPVHNYPYQTYWNGNYYYWTGNQWLIWTGYNWAPVYQQQQCVRVVRPAISLNLGSAFGFWF